MACASVVGARTQMDSLTRVSPIVMYLILMSMLPTAERQHELPSHQARVRHQCGYDTHPMVATHERAKRPSARRISRQLLPTPAARVSQSRRSHNGSLESESERVYGTRVSQNEYLELPLLGRGSACSAGSSELVFVVAECVREVRRRLGQRWRLLVHQGASAARRALLWPVHERARERPGWIDVQRGASERVVGVWACTTRPACASDRANKQLMLLLLTVPIQSIHPIHPIHPIDAIEERRSRVLG